MELNFIPKSPRVIPKIAYQMEEKNGGFQLFRITFNDDYSDLHKLDLKGLKNKAKILGIVRFKLPNS